MTKKLYIEIIFLFFLGVFSSLSLPPYNFLLINFFTFSALLIFLIKKSKEHKKKNLFFLYGWLFGFGYFISNLYWISFALTFDKNFSSFIPFVIILLPSILALFYGLISFFFILFMPRGIISSFLSFSLIFAILEFIRGSILTGFPWNLIAYSFTNQLEILSIISITGTYGFNLFCITLFVSPAIFIIKDNKKDVLVFIFFIVTLFCFYFYGSFREEKFNKSISENRQFKIRVIGANISLERFYKNVDTISIIEDLIKISAPKADEKTIFLWPEAMLPNILKEDLVQYSFLFEKKFNENHLFIIGTNSKTDENSLTKYFNSLTVYDNNLKILNSYDKIKLVPFGEFLPLENFLKLIGIRSLTNNYQSYSSGNVREIIEINRENFSLKILPLICYEIIYSGSLSSKFNFDLIINISEDGWFGKTIGPEQHFAHSIFRAIESGKYLARSSNNGITALINPLGKAEKIINHGQSGYIDFEERRKIQPTIFSKYGNKIFLMLILLYIFLIFSFNKIRNEQS